MFLLDRAALLGVLKIMVPRLVLLVEFVGISNRISGIAISGYFIAMWKKAAISVNPHIHVLFTAPVDMGIAQVQGFVVGCWLRCGLDPRMAIAPTLNAYHLLRRGVSAGCQNVARVNSWAPHPPPYRPLHLPPG